MYDISNRNTWVASPVTDLSSSIFAETTINVLSPDKNDISLSATKLLVSVSIKGLYIYSLDCSEGLGTIFSSCEMCEPGTCPSG